MAAYLFECHGLTSYDHRYYFDRKGSFDWQAIFSLKKLTLLVQTPKNEKGINKQLFYYIERIPYAWEGDWYHKQSTCWVKLRCQFLCLQKAIFWIRRYEKEVRNIFAQIVQFWQWPAVRQGNVFSCVTGDLFWAENLPGGRRDCTTLITQTLITLDIDHTRHWSHRV